MSCNDFDFLLGHWRVHHRRLAVRLAGCADWVEFGGTSHAQALMAGRANVDDNLLELPGQPYRATTLRSFDPMTGTWAIWWLDSRAPHHLDPPVVGAFADGVGTFYADDVLEGRPIRVRFVWSDITPGSCRWEQAFSADGGATWETNWIMTFTRA